MYLSLLTIIVIVYVFFSLAKTKMPSFTIVAALPIFISFASFIDYLFSRFEKLRLPPVVVKSFASLLLLTVAVSRFDVELLQYKHALGKKESGYYHPLLHNAAIFKGLNLPANAVVFNVKLRHYIEAMFYTGLPAYNFIPSEEQYLDMKKKGRVIALFMPEDGKLPSFVESDSSVILIREKLEGWE